MVETHKTYEDLADEVDKTADIEAFVDQTLSLAQSHDEEWRNHYDALDNLRVLNKFHYDVLDKAISKFRVFISVQVENLRSNNSRNALMLFHEIFDH